jgi:ASC-1-like (ASCH) protein
MNHEMTLSEPHFQNVRDQLKIYELRLQDEKRLRVKAGDTVTWTKEGECETVCTRVMKIDMYDSFASALKDKGISRTIPGVETLEDCEAVYYGIRGFKDREQKLGVVCAQQDIDKEKQKRRKTLQDQRKKDAAQRLAAFQAQEAQRLAQVNAQDDIDIDKYFEM